MFHSSSIAQLPGVVKYICAKIKVSKTKPAFVVPFVVQDGERFADPKHKWIYRIPIPRIMHPKYGRMEINLEPLYAGGKLSSLILTFLQHEIKELETPVEIKTPQADRNTGVMTLGLVGSHDGVSSFFGNVWSAHYCPVHRTLALSSYPPDGCVALLVSALQTAVSVYYEVSELKSRPTVVPIPADPVLVPVPAPAPAPAEPVEAPQPRVASVAPMDRMMEDLQSAVGRKVSLVYSEYGRVSAEHGGELRLVSPYIRVEIGSRSVPFIGYGCAILRIWDWVTKRILYSNDQLPSPYDMRDENAIQDLIARCFGVEVARQRGEQVKESERTLGIQIGSPARETQ